MKLLLTTTALALCLATSAFASPIIGSDSHDTNISNTPVASANSDASALAGAVSGSVSGANAVNTAITGPATATNTSVNSLNGGDNRATVGNVSSSSGPSTSNASLGSLNKFGGDASVVAGQDQHQSTATTTSTSTQQAQTLTDSSVHTQSTTASTGASTSSANGNGAGQTTSITTNYEAQKRNPVSSAYAAPLQIGSLVCGMSKVSGALQLPGVGASGQVGSIDAGCERRSTADVFARLGLTYEACIIMVRDPVATAAGLSEATCQRPVAAVAQVVTPPAPTAPAPTARMDPIPNPVPVQDGERHARVPRGA